MKKAVFIFGILLLAALSYSQNNFILDKNHSRLGFSAMHFGISHVEGRFKSFEANMKASKEDFTDAEI
jgi:polyisoprenoid-binding protein YceI